MFSRIRITLKAGIAAFVVSAAAITVVPTSASAFGMGGFGHMGGMGGFSHMGGMGGFSHMGGFGNHMGGSGGLGRAGGLGQLSAGRSFGNEGNTLHATHATGSRQTQFSRAENTASYKEAFGKTGSDKSGTDKAASGKATSDNAPSDKTNSKSAIITDRDAAPAKAQDASSKQNQASEPSAATDNKPAAANNDSLVSVVGAGRDAGGGMMVRPGTEKPLGYAEASNPDNGQTIRRTFNGDGTYIDTATVSWGSTPDTGVVRVDDQPKVKAKIVKDCHLLAAKVAQLTKQLAWQEGVLAALGGAQNVTLTGQTFGVATTFDDPADQQAAIARMQNQIAITGQLLAMFTADLGWCLAGGN